MDTSVLEKAGLSPNEVKVYIALTSVGGCTSGPLIKTTKLNSAKVYESLLRLQQKGLVGYVNKDGKKFFSPAPPRRLIDHIDEQKLKLDAEKKALKCLIPELNLLRKEVKEEQQSASVYQGLRSCKMLFEEMFDEVGSNGEYIAIGSGLFKSAMGPYWFQFQKRKKELNIRSRLLWDKGIVNHPDYLSTYHGDGRIISGGSFTGPVGLWVYNNKLLEFNHADNAFFAVLTSSKALADSYRDIFETLWKTSKPLPRKFVRA